ncbi:MAG: hypothetical protein HKO53_13635 [Gemmatimonadetes bacterium]|nr:hypothetical protein [Gemmatimonadota bacterium]
MSSRRPHPNDPVSPDSATRALGSSALVWAARVLVTAAVTLAILRAVGIRMVDIREVRVDPALIHPSWIGGSALLLLLAFGASALLWRGLVRALGGPSVSAWTAVGVTLVANLGRYLPGKVFQLLGLVLLGRRVGIPAGVSAGAAVLGQVLHLVAAALVGSSLMGATGVLPKAWRYLPLVVAGVIVVVVAWPGMAGRLLTLAGRFKGPTGGAPARGAPRTLLPWAVGYALNWLLLGLAFQALAWGLGIPLSYGLAVSAFAAAYFLGYVALFAPAGLGVREGFLVAFLGPTVGPGPAVALATAQRVWMTGVEALGAAAVWPGIRTTEPADGEAGGAL